MPTQTINPKPYVPIENQDFDELIVNLENKNFNGIVVQPGKIAVVFKFCFLNELIIESLEKIEFEEVSVSFNNCFIGNFDIQKLTADNISLSFHACMFSGRIAASNIVGLSINNCILETSLFLSAVPKIQISYTTENIFPYWWKRLFDKRGIQDYKPILNQHQRYHIENPKSLKVSSSKKGSDQPGKYIIAHNTGEYRVGYKLSEEEEALLNIYLNVSFDTDNVDEVTSIENLTLHSFSLSGSPQGKIYVENTHIGNWYLSEFLPKQDVSFYNINPKNHHSEETKIGIHKSNLDNVWFDNVYFNEFQRLSFYRSKFSNAVFTSCNFPEKYAAYEKFTPIENIHYPENTTSNPHKDQYEIFLQLKKALEATGNYYEALKLQAISHTALKKVKTITRTDKLILSINQISNNHGLSIRKPFIGFLIVSICFYLAYLKSLDLVFESTDFDPNLIGYYFSFIDLTHRSDFLLSKEELNGLALAFDSLHKIAIGFFIYQFIASFRKYGKS